MSEIDHDGLGTLISAMTVPLGLYLGMPPYSKDKMLTALNACMSLSAWLLFSTGEDRDTTRAWFIDGVDSEIADLAEKP